MCLINVLTNRCKMATPQEKAQSWFIESWFIEMKSNVQTQQKYRSMEEIRHHVLEFMDGTRNL